MGALLISDSPARSGATFGTCAIEQSLRRMVCRGTVQRFAHSKHSAVHPRMIASVTRPIRAVRERQNTDLKPTSLQGTVRQSGSELSTGCSR